MSGVTRCELPSPSLIDSVLAHDDERLPLTHRDSYCCVVDGEISLEQFVQAFYTTWLFKLERVILKYLVKRPSTDAQVKELLAGSRTRFAAWTLEKRTSNELLMVDMDHKTKSWFMVASDAASGKTKLYFGSVVMATPNRKTGELELGKLFDVAMPLHLLYSRALLGLTKARLVRQRG